MSVNIKRTDRGLDFKRIEKFIELFDRKADESIREINSKEKEIEDKYEQEAYKEFNLDKEFDSIDSINEEIAALKEKIQDLEKKKEPHEQKVRSYTQPKDDRWGYYKDVRKGSKVQEYIDSKKNNEEEIKSSLQKIKSDLRDSIWFAKDLEHAIDIYNSFMKKVKLIMDEEQGF